MFAVGSVSTAATQTKKVGGAVIRVTVFADVPPIITIDVVELAEKLGNQPLFTMSEVSYCDREYYLPVVDADGALIGVVPTTDQAWPTWIENQTYTQQLEAGEYVEADIHYEPVRYTADGVHGIYSLACMKFVSGLFVLSIPIGGDMPAVCTAIAADTEITEATMSGFFEGPKLLVETSYCSRTRYPERAVDSSSGMFFKVRQTKSMRVVSNFGSAVQIQFKEYVPASECPV